MKHKNWEIRLLQCWDDIESNEFQTLWHNMVMSSSNAHVFFHPVLAKVWLDTYRPLRNLQPIFVHATRDGQQVIFPLVLWTRNWKNAFVRMVIPVGYSDYDYHDPLFERKPTVDEVDSFYAAFFQILEQRVKYDQIVLDGLHDDYRPYRATLLRTEACLSWSLEDVESNEGFILPSKKRLAQDVLRRYRRLQEKGSVSFRQFHAEDAADIHDTIAIMLDFHSKRWPKSYKAPSFHSHLIDAGLRAGIIQFVEMSFNNQPIAWQIGFTFQKNYYHYMPAIDESFMSSSPGHLSLGYALSQAKQQGLKSVDHLRGGEDYKSAWGGEKKLIHDVSIDNDSPLSMARLGFGRGLRYLKDNFMGAR